MSTKDELIIENELLKRKLALAEAWMRKEVVTHQKNIAREGVKGSKRKQLDNILERESVDIITRKIETYFGGALVSAPKYSINHLIDAEIYWQTLQKFPGLDALPVVSSYQKILEGFFERIIVGFRQYANPQRTKHFSHALSGISRTQENFDHDIENVLKKRYSLSLGRWYYFFEKIRGGSEFGGEYEDLFLEFMTIEYKSVLELCISEPFFTQFSTLITLEVFGKKRHENKVSYSDAETVRTICMGHDKNTSLLFLLMSDSSS